MTANMGGGRAGDTSGPSVRERLLVATRAVLDEVGESGLTLAKVVRRAGLTTGAVYSNFENREELIVAVMLEDFRGRILDDVERMREVMTGPLTGADYRRALASVVPRPDDEARREVRWLRARALAAAQRYEAVRAEMTDLQHHVTARILDVIDEATAAGRIASGTDPRALAQLIQSLGFSLVFADLAGDLAPDPDDWVDLVMQVMSRVLVIPD